MAAKKRKPKLKKGSPTPATIQVKPFEELWVRKNRERVEHIFLKEPIENKTGN